MPPKTGEMRYMTTGHFITKPNEASKRSSAPSPASGKPGNTTAKTTAPTKPVQRTQPKPSATDQMVREVIKSVQAETAERKRRADEFDPAII